MLWGVGEAIRGIRGMGRRVGRNHLPGQARMEQCSASAAGGRQAGRRVTGSMGGRQKAEVALSAY
eukprot:1984558-Prorocentrum_lima.AAC.1